MKKKYLIILLILLILSILYYLIKTNRNLTKPEIIIKETILSIESLIIKPFSKTEKLCYEEILKTELEESKRKIDELENILNINNNLSDYEIINATVINRSISNWYSTLTIDKGLNQGIKNNMAVVTNGLIGRIEKASDNYSNVKLLTSLNEQFKISVKIESDNYIYGILDNYKNGYFRLTGLSNNKEIKENLKVETTGLDDIFPSGILIGYTSKQEKDNMNLENIIYVKSIIDLDDINYVTVLKRKIQ